MKKLKKIILTLILVGLSFLPLVSFAKDIVSSSSSGEQMVQLSNGKFAVFSADGAFSGIYQQFYNADYTRAGDPVYIGTGTMERDTPQVIATLNGNSSVAYVFIWRSTIPHTNGNYYIKMQRFRSNGTKYGGPIWAGIWKTPSSSNIAVGAARILALANGKWEIFYFNANRDYKRKIYNANGSAATGELSIPGNTLRNGRFFQLKSGFIYLIDDTYSTPGSVKFQRFDANGAPVGGIVTVATTYPPHGSSQYSIRVDLQPLSTGKFVIAWYEGITSASNSYTRVYLQKYYANGTKWGGQIGVSNNIKYSAGPPNIAEVGNGGWVVVWGQGSTNYADGKVMQRRYNSSGTASSIQEVGLAGSYGHDFQAMSKSNGGWSVIYDDNRGSTYLTQKDYTSSGILDSTVVSPDRGYGLVRPLKNFNYLSKALYLTGDTVYNYINLPSSTKQGLDIGLRLKESSGIVKIAAELATNTTSPLRIAKGGKKYSLLLVPPSDSCASSTRVKTSSGIMALQKYGCGEGAPDPINGGWTGWRSSSLGTRGYSGTYDYQGSAIDVYNKWVLSGSGGSYCLYKINLERFCINKPFRYGGNDCSGLDGGNNRKTITGYSHKVTGNHCLNKRPYPSPALHDCVDYSDWANVQVGDYNASGVCIPNASAP